ncbi:MAG: bifunctional anthranilate synthase component II/anthranilate phosphoribosyltransferase [Treponema sp.]|nr:bifunctional anthranilate synthase component II/anthranilate phosphoribosyltransferase [Treponema sp.]
MKVVIVDNYDSFTYNVVQSFQALDGAVEVVVLRSGECTVSDIERLAPDYLVISPGPGRPCDAGVSEEAIKHFAGKIPVLGICLGHQAMAEAFGAKIVQAKFIKHGIVEEINLDGKGLFRTIGKKGKFTRYHSLVVDEKTLPEEFEVTARAEDGDIMGIRHKKFALEGVQFHPESIASDNCEKLLRSFLNYRRENLPSADFLNRLIAKKDLSETEAEFFMENMTDGTMDERIMAAILVAMASKGVASSEIAGCARVLMKKKRKFPLELSGHAEIVGTGGDEKGSFNISSLSAIVAASLGQTIIKHGNRAVSSKSGAADFYESLGIKIDAAPEQTSILAQKTGFAFLMAPVYHSAMRFATPVRKALGIKTIMNILGPLLNPSEPDYAVLGVYSEDLLETYARAAKKLGTKRVMVVHSRDGYDEISPCAPTDVFQITESGKESRYVIDPAKFGIEGLSENDLLGGSGEDNARLAMEILEGKGRAAIRASIGLNTAAVLYLSGKAKTLKDGYDLALGAIDSGAALKKLREIQAVSKEI